MNKPNKRNAQLPRKNSLRNRKIVEFVLANDWSYQLVADHFKVSRCTVAGIVFRHHHPKGERVGDHKNMIGTGYAERSYYPSYHAKNSEVRSA